MYLVHAIFQNVKKETRIVFFYYRSSTDETIAIKTTSKITIIVPTGVVLVLVAISIAVVVIIKRRKVNCLQCKGNITQT